MGKIILYIVSIGLILVIASALWPYWNEYLINSDLKAAALYGTKHSIEETQRFFNKKKGKRGFVYDPAKLHIAKDENKTVSIKLTYQDKISLFGIVLKELEFKLDVTKQYIKEYA